MQITNKIHLLKHEFDITLAQHKKIPRFVYSIIILAEEITLIDCGVKNSWENIFKYIESNGRKPEEIKSLILSHSHPDHIGSANKIKETTGCKVLAHVDEQEWFEDIELQFKERPVPGFYNLVDEPVQIDEFIEHNQEIKVDENITLKVIHSPGHSKGSINLLFIEDKILFTADSIPLKNDIPNYDNYHDLKTSLHQIANNKEYAMLLSSWAPPVSDKLEILKLIEESVSYLEQLDTAINVYYTGGIEKVLECCSQVIEDLGLPEFYVNPIVDKAFRTHLE